jgi:hypothetical protein
MRLFAKSIRAAALAALAATSLAAGQWSEPVAVQHQYKTCVEYQAKFDGPYLVVKAKVEPGWHTFAMDNELRAEEALKGEMSLGVDGPTKIEPGSGVAITGPWMQSEPEDFSKPEMRWYSWGYGSEAIFAAKASASGGPAVVRLSGQACSDTTCKNIDVEIAVPAGGGDSTLDVSRLVAVRTAK